VTAAKKSELLPASNTINSKFSLPGQGIVERSENLEDEEDLPAVEEKNSKSTR
jgi:hypothetical protein